MAHNLDSRSFDLPKLKVCDENINVVYELSIRSVAPHRRAIWPLNKFMPAWPPLNKSFRQHGIKSPCSIKVSSTLLIMLTRPTTWWLLVGNRIWPCQTHSRLIDADEAAYLTSRLHAMKAEHEARIQHEMSNMQAYPEPSDFIALGPDMAFLGELVAVEAQARTFRVDHFVIGDPGVLIQYIEKFETPDPYDKYVLSTELGDGRNLSLAHSWPKSESGVIIKTHVISSRPRISANRLLGDIVLTDDHDIFISNGQIEVISRLKALPQRIKTCLSIIRGESSFWPKYGSRIQEYIAEFFDSPWLPRLIKLKTIRMAAIPYSVDIGRPNFTTPLHCVRRVLSVDQVDSGDGKGWMKFRFCLDVEGIGEWIQEIPIFVSQ